MSFDWAANFHKDCRLRSGFQTCLILNALIECTIAGGGSGATTVTAQRSIAIERTFIEGIKNDSAEIKVEINTINGVHISSLCKLGWWLS